jgi:hypothetical protein
MGTILINAQDDKSVITFELPDKKTINGMNKSCLDASLFAEKKSIVIWEVLENIEYFPNYNSDFYFDKYNKYNNLIVHFKTSIYQEHDNKVTFDFLKKKSKITRYDDPNNTVVWKPRPEYIYKMYPIRIRTSKNPKDYPIYFSVDPPLYFTSGYIEGYTDSKFYPVHVYPPKTWYQIIRMETFEDLIQVLKPEYQELLISYILENIEEELNRLPLFAPKDEFESNAEYSQRQDKANEFRLEINNKYTLIYKELVESWENERIEKIKNSYTQVNLEISQLGTYNIEKETFPITFVGLQPLELKIPKQEAKSFKENLQNVKVTAHKQLKEDAVNIKYFNVEITHPVTGSKYLMLEEQPSYLGYISKDVTEIGIPKLESSIEFIEPSGNNILDGDETARFVVTIVNNGDGNAQNINILLSMSVFSGISFDKAKNITGIAPNQSQTAIFEVKADRTISNNEIQFTFDFTEARGFKPGAINYTINTQSFKAPHLELKDVGIKEITGNGNNIIENGENIEVSVLIQNTGQGMAEDAMAVFSINDPNIISLTPAKMKQSMGILQPGEDRIIIFNISVNYDYNGSDLLPISLVLSEKYKEYGGSYPLNLEMKKVSLSTANIRVEGQYSGEMIIKDVSLTSDVDKNIPENSLKYNNRYALVIGNENYSKYQTGLNSESNVDFANNDAIVFSQYCEKTLRIPKENITLLTDAGSPQMNSAIEKLSKLAQYSNGVAELIFYYAGHGFPDEGTNDAYIIPVDISGANVKYGIKLNDLYSKLTVYPAKRITVFLDACFSGGARNQSLLAARGIKVKPKENIIQGNLIVITASSGDQSSLPYKEKQHGIFTYYLLKKLQDSKGDVSYKYLTDYIINSVQLNAVKINNKEQNPGVLISPDLENWEYLKLND